MKAMIFGVTGQDGSYLAEFLLAKGYNVIGVKRRSSTANLVNLRAVLNNTQFSLVEGDVTDYGNLISLVTAYRPDEIYNLSAQSHVGTSFNEPIHTWDVTAKGCMNLLEVIRYLSCDSYKPRFYQASSSEMFGSMYSILTYSDDGYYTNVQNFDYNLVHPDEVFKPVDAVGYQDEDTPFKPQSPYAIAKAAAHNAVGLYRRAYNIHGSSGILFNHESPRRGENFVTRKVTKYVGKLAVDIELPSFSNSYPKLRLGNLDAKRDWGFAGDYVEAMWLMLQQPAGDDYVICTGQTHSVRELCETAFNVIGLDYNNYVVIDDKFKRPAEVPHLLGNSDKANSILKWKPKVEFSELIPMMVKADIDEQKKSRV